MTRDGVGKRISEARRKNSSANGASVTHRSEWLAWSNMLKRCYNHKDPQYYDYGGRGIIVCDEWRESFWNFLKDMGKKPSPELTLERQDNEIGYCPENCVWASRYAQTRNERRNINITFNGRTQCVTDWAKELGLSRQSLVHRLKHWGVERAMTTPKDPDGGLFRRGHAFQSKRPRSKSDSCIG